MTYDEWKTTAPESDEPCAECDGRGEVVISDHLNDCGFRTGPCPQCTGGWDPADDE